MIELIEGAHIVDESMSNQIYILSEFEHNCLNFDNKSCVMTLISCRIQVILRLV